MKTYNEKGRSMVEMIGVIAIIGVISAGGLVGYSRAMYRYQMNKIVSTMTDALQNYALFLKRGMDTYPTIETVKQVRQYDLINDCMPIKPECMSDNSDDEECKFCKMPLGKLYPNFSVSEGVDTEGVEVLEYTYNLKLSFEKAQRNACIDFLVHDWNHMVPDRWWHHGAYITITANTADITSGHIVYSSSVNKLSPAGATDACSTVCPEGTSVCNVIFHFVGEKY